MIAIQIVTRGEFKLAYFELPLGGVDPVQVAAEIEAVGEQLAGPETVLLRGQGPVWVYAMLTHARTLPRSSPARMATSWRPSTTGGSSRAR